MLIDCDTCIARGEGCADCVVSVMLGEPPAAPPGRGAAPPRSGSRMDLDDAERSALARLARAGLVPPLRVVPMPAQEYDRIA